MAKRKLKKIKRSKKVKEIKLNKNFTYVLAGIGMFLTVKGLEGLGSGATGAVIGASQTNVTLISIGSFFVGAFLAVFAVNQLVKKK